MLLRRTACDGGCAASSASVGCGTGISTPWYASRKPGSGSYGGCGPGKPICRNSGLLDFRSASLQTECSPMKTSRCMSSSKCQANRSEEHMYELQSLMRISYAASSLIKKKDTKNP